MTAKPLHGPADGTNVCSGQTDPGADPNASEGQPGVRWFTSLAIVIACVGVVILLLPNAQASTTRTPAELHKNFLCIHHYEGSWTDRGAPYWGGLQMDRPFMRTYGREYYNAWGTADHWPASIQIAVAMRAYLSGRGFYPWPNTARKCGLL